MSLDLKKLREVATEATPGPWGPWSANIPFNIIVEKPAPSLSKHDLKRPDFWRYEDGLHVLYFQPKNALALLDEIDRLKYAFGMAMNVIEQRNGQLHDLYCEEGKCIDKCIANEADVTALRKIYDLL